MFSNALLALSIIELTERIPKSEPTKASKTVETLVKNILSESAKEIFPHTLNPSYGAFYLGWSNFTLKKYIASPIFISAEEKETYQSVYKKHSF